MSPGSSFASKVAAALKIDLPYTHGRHVKPGTPAAVLALFSAGDTPSLLLTRRTETVENHKGQIAFPGGVCDPEDEATGGVTATALRETEEELGLGRERIQVIGRMPDLYTTTGFLVAPIVGVVEAEPAEVVLRANPAEIADMFWVSLARLREDGIYRQEQFRVGAVGYPIDVFQIGEHRVWGVTGSIIKNLLDRLGRLE